MTIQGDYLEFFIFSLAVSVFSATLGISKILKVGVIKIVQESENECMGGFFTMPTILSFLATISSLVAKGVVSGLCGLLFATVCIYLFRYCQAKV